MQRPPSVPDRDDRRGARLRSEGLLDDAQLVVEAAIGKLHPDATVAEATMWGVRTVLVYRLNKTEHARRKAASASPLSDLWLLDALLKLPTGRAVALTALPGRDQRLLARGQRTHSADGSSHGTPSPH